MIQEELGQRIKTVTDLQGIVKTMKMLSSVSVGQYERALNSLTQYSKTLQKAFHGLFTQDSFQYTPPEVKEIAPKILAIVIGSDNGLVGKFNKEVLNSVQDFCVNRQTPKNQIRIIGIGKRIALLAPGMDFHVASAYPMSNSVKEISTLAGLILTKIDHEVSEHHFDLVQIFYNKQQNLSFVPQTHQLIPLPHTDFQRLKKTRWEGRMLPLITAEQDVLFSALLHEYFIIQLTNAITSSLAAEHFTRMNHMQQAEKNIEEKLNVLNLQYQQARQNQITEELIDIVSGATALIKKKAVFHLTNDKKRNKMKGIKKGERK